MILYSLQIVVKEKTKNIASSDFRAQTYKWVFFPM